MDNNLLWILLVAAAVFVAYYLCNNKKTGYNAPIANLPGVTAPVEETPIIYNTAPTTPFETVQPIVNVQIPFSRRQSTLTFTHDEPLLGTIFSRDVDILPAGISREDFEKEVAAYQNQHLKETEMQIPRSLNFNYDRLEAEAESMRRNVSATASRFTQREDLGSISEAVVKNGGAALTATATATLAPRTFMKKAVAKR